MRYSWFIKRLFRAFIAIFISITLTFIIIRAMPGNPASAYVNELVYQGVPLERAIEMASKLYNLDLNKPLWQQYLDYLLNVLRGNLGYSIVSAGLPVINIVMYALPWTLYIVSISLLISFVIGILLGLYMAYHRGGLVDKILTSIGTVFSSIPNYIMALLLYYSLVTILKVIPPISGAYDPNLKPGLSIEFISSVLMHSFLPILTFILTSFGGWMLTMRNTAIVVLGQDFVMAAEARGLKKNRIMFSYVGKNAMLPLFTSLMISIGWIFGGAVFIENTFAYPGIGRLLALALSSRDYTVVQGCFLFITIAVIISNLLADILYGVIDPRLRYE